MGIAQGFCDLVNPGGCTYPATCGCPETPRRRAGAVFRIFTDDLEQPLETMGTDQLHLGKVVAQLTSVSSGDASGHHRWCVVIVEFIEPAVAQVAEF